MEGLHTGSPGRYDFDSDDTSSSSGSEDCDTGHEELAVGSNAIEQPQSGTLLNLCRTLGSWSKDRPNTLEQTQQNIIVAAQTELLANKLGSRQLASGVKLFTKEQKKTKKYRDAVNSLAAAVTWGQQLIADATINQQFVTNKMQHIQATLIQYQQRVARVTALSNALTKAEEALIRLELIQASSPSHVESFTPLGDEPYTSFFFEGQATPSPKPTKTSCIVTTHGGTDDLFDRTTSCSPKAFTSTAHGWSDEVFAANTSCSPVAGPSKPAIIEAEDANVQQMDTFQCAWQLVDKTKPNAKPRACGKTFNTLTELKRHKAMSSLDHFEFNCHVAGPIKPDGLCGLHLVRPRASSLICKGLKNGGKDNNARKKHLVDRLHLIDFKVLMPFCTLCDTKFPTNEAFVQHFQRNHSCVMPSKNKLTIQENKTEDEVTLRAKRERVVDLVTELAEIACQGGKNKKQRVEELRQRVVDSLQEL